MDRTTALAVFGKLETASLYSEDEVGPEQWNPPAYEVRLDATTGRDSDRTFRLRVTPGGDTGGIDTDDWRFVFDLAAEHELAADVQNSGIELH